MLQFIENFYPYGASGSQLAAANTNFNTQWITHGTGAAIIADGFHDGSKAVDLPRTGSTYAQVERRFTSTDDTVIVGYAFRATARGAATFQVLQDSTVVMSLEWPNQFQVGSDVGTATILLNKTYFVEVKLVKSTKLCTVKVNGYDYLTSTLINTIPDTMQCYWGFGATGTSADYMFSDVYFADGATGKFTDFVGPQQVVSRTISAEVDPGWTATPSTKTRVQIMNNIPAKVGEYTEADTVGQQDLYTSADTIPDGTVINATAVTSLLTKTDIDDQYVALKVDDGSNEKLGADFAIQIQPAYFQQVFETDVSGTNWTPTTVLNASFGPVIRPRP